MTLDGTALPPFELWEPPLPELESRIHIYCETHNLSAHVCRQLAGMISNHKNPRVETLSGAPYGGLHFSDGAFPVCERADILECAYVSYNDGELNAARVWFSAVVAQAERAQVPVPSAAFHGLAAVARDQGDHGTAERFLQRSMEQASSGAAFDADSAGALFESRTALAILRFHQKRYDEATDWFTRALSLKPTEPLAVLNLGKALTEQGRYEEALAIYGHVIGLSLEVLEVIVPLALVYAEDVAIGNALNAYISRVRLGEHTDSTNSRPQIMNRSHLFDAAMILSDTTSGAEVDIVEEIARLQSSHFSIVNHVAIVYGMQRRRHPADMLGEIRQWMNSLRATNSASQTPRAAYASSQNMGSLTASSLSPPELHLIVEAFLPNTPERQREIEECLRINVLNSGLHQIHLLAESAFHARHAMRILQDLPWNLQAKVRPVIIGSRCVDKKRPEE